MSANPIRVCAVIAEETIDAARKAMSEAATQADLLELRLDYLRDFDFSDANNLRQLLGDKPLPIIITCRDVSEGGKQHVDDRVRLRLLVEGARHLAEYCDIEAAHYEEAARLSPDLSRLIVSYHNFHETPSELDAVYDRVTALPAAVHKIVTHANTTTDSLGSFHLLDRAQSDGKKLIALAMGEAGLMTRVLGPSRGCFLTYGSIAAGRESALGQVACEELINLYRIRKLTAHTGVTGIIGSPVGHSASPAMHNRAFAALDLDLVYLPFEVSDLFEFLCRFVTSTTREPFWNLRGLSVTIPHKTAVIPLLDEVDVTARRIGAVNTVVVDQGRLIGYNTDVEGAIEPLEKVCALAGERCGVVGAGGASRAVIYGLLERGASVTIFARDIEKARLVAKEFHVSVAPLDSLVSSNVRVIINTTPVGMRGHSEGSSPVPAKALDGRRTAYDLVYNPVETRFLKAARRHGCHIVSGLDMLVAQAALQFELWTGKKPPIEEMRHAAMGKILL